MDRPDDIVREVLVRAPLGTVFATFTDPARFAAFWGAGSTIDARPGGALLVVHPGGATASGVVKELVARERIVFTYGYDAPGKPIGPGGSTIIVTFADTPAGARVTLRHTDLPDAATAKEHVQGWRYQLALLAKVIARAHHAGAARMADGWFAAWAEPDPAARRAALLACSVPGVWYRDDFSYLVGHDDLDAHIAASHIHMPGVVLTRVGDAVQCQGAALVRWEARSGEKVVAKGANVFELAPDGRIQTSVGFWGA